MGANAFAAPPAWQTMAPENAEATGDVTLEIQRDLSILARSSEPNLCAYTITGQSPLEEVAAIRLEVLPHKSLPGGGPGRAHHGNFILSKFEAEVVSADGSATPITFEHGMASYEQDGGWNAAESLRDTGKGWAVANQFGRAHQAVFVADKPVAFPDGARLRVVLDHRDQAFSDHVIGCFRLSVADQAPTAPPVVQPGRPASVSVLIITGVEHPAHDWKAKSAALKEILELDPRLSVSIAEDPEYLARRRDLRSRCDPPEFLLAQAELPRRQVARQPAPICPR